MTSISPPSVSPITWKIRHWAAIWFAGQIGGILLSAMVLPIWTGDPLGPEFFFFVGLPSLAISQVAALSIGMVKLGARLDRDLGFDVQWRDLRVIPWAIVNAVLLAFLLEPLARAVDASGPSQAELNLFGTANQTALFIGVLLAAGFAPIYEELLFRGMLQRALGHRFSRLPSIGFTALIFGLFHILTVDASLGQWLIRAGFVVLSITLLGLVLSWLADRDGRLGRTIVFHTTHNLLVIVVTVMAVSESGS